ncbi:hypothetical protein DRO26_03405 [Candidatus Bathyarchaeota archaeon]|nr:MAG: hypothetical protein DRO26_03405 [Candidatus Bathyarchaeota archaeon]
MIQLRVKFSLDSNGWYGSVIVPTPTTPFFLRLTSTQSFSEMFFLAQTKDPHFKAKPSSLRILLE